jgi:hypothetical protein
MAKVRTATTSTTAVVMMIYSRGYYRRNNLLISMGMFMGTMTPIGVQGVYWKNVH